MVKQKLYNADGELVAEVVTPFFMVRPEAITWGSRMFFWCQQHRQYREGLAVAAIDVETACRLFHSDEDDFPADEAQPPRSAHVL